MSGLQNILIPGTTVGTNVVTIIDLFKYISSSYK